METDTLSFAAIIAEWGKPADFARALGHDDGGDLARKWRRRDSIPQEWWPEVIDAARRDGKPVDAERLLRAQRNAVSRKAGADGGAASGQPVIDSPDPERPASGYDARSLDALENQARSVKAVFAQAGFVPVEPPTMQPADIFLNRSGEDIRQRTYVFEDPGGEEWCLRPDLTIPTCRMYLERDPSATTQARLCYNGPAYRYQPPGAGKPTEFLQAGVEHIGGSSTPEADAAIVTIAVEAVQSAGLTSFDITLGDLGLFSALVDKLDLPPSWRARLKRHIWRPAYFDEMLSQLTDAGQGGARSAAPATNATDTTNQALLAALDVMEPDRARDVVQDVLALAGISAVGGRTVAEISERFLEQAADAARAVLPRETADAIRAFLAISAPCTTAVDQLASVASRAGVSLDDELDAITRRVDLICAQGVPRNTITFDADFGRKEEYYTGFVFELRVEALGASRQVAGGGRYDGLLKSLGSPRNVAAVGCAIRTERLLAAVGLERQP
ncbi:ATP phosphoribosyltransferase regulatory subunit [Pyruvatibacter sp.]|uniref:ATP phosphoribosyltransferase regulatory subunit n=1 Tax=Pyruvatibacter sp. TaxID=1981328 RepID=UPI0032ECFB23